MQAGSSLPSRLLWFVALWAGGTAALGIIAYIIRAIIRVG